MTFPLPRSQNIRRRRRRQVTNRNEFLVDHTEPRPFPLPKRRRSASERGSWHRKRPSVRPSAHTSNYLLSNELTHPCVVQHVSVTGFWLTVAPLPRRACLASFKSKYGKMSSFCIVAVRLSPPAVDTAISLRLADYLPSFVEKATPRRSATARRRLS